MDLTKPIKKMKEDNEWPLSWTSAIGLVPKIAALGSDITGCELGVSYGFNLVYFLDNLPNIKKVYAIDPYMPYDDGPGGYVTQEVIDRVKQCMLNNIEPHKDKVEFINKMSKDAVKDIPDDSLDYIFIDGDHSYEAVASDMEIYYSKVKSGGIFAGHDRGLVGVDKAISEFAAKHNLNSPEECANACWYWVKK